MRRRAKTGGLPDAAAVAELGACLNELWRDEQPRGRLVARVALGSNRGPVSAQAEALGSCLAALRPWVGAVQVRPYAVARLLHLDELGSLGSNRCRRVFNWGTSF